MISHSVLLLVLTLVVVTSTENSTNNSRDCAVLVDNPKSLFGHSKHHTSPLGQYLVERLQQCVDKCCLEEISCNVGLFTEYDESLNKTNCVLYNCNPLEACSMKIGKDAQVFVATSALEVNTAFSSASSMVPSHSEYVADDNGDVDQGEGTYREGVVKEDVNENYVKENLHGTSIIETTRMSAIQIMSSSVMMETSSLLQTATTPLEQTAAPELGLLGAPVLEQTAAPELEQTAVSGLEQTAPPALEQTAVPELEQTPLTELIQTAVPALEQTASPKLEQTAVPELKQTAALELEQATAPVLEQTVAPVLEQTTATELEQTAASELEQTAAPELKETAALELEQAAAPALEQTSPPALDQTTATELEQTVAPTLEQITTSVFEQTAILALEPTTAPAFELAPQATPTITSANAEESLTNYSIFATATEKSITSIEEIVNNLETSVNNLDATINNQTFVNSVISKVNTSHTAALDISEQFIIIQSTPFVANENTAGSFLDINSIAVANIIFTNKSSTLSSTIESSFSQTISDTSLDALLTSRTAPFAGIVSTDAIEVIQTSGFSVSSGEVTAAETEEGNQGLSSTLETTQSMEVLISPTVDHVFPPSDSAVHNGTEFEDVLAFPEITDGVTAILICVLTFGCMFVLAVIGILGVKVYEGYRKRHYSRLDYLINGMYS